VPQDVAPLAVGNHSPDNLQQTDTVLVLAAPDSTSLAIQVPRVQLRMHLIGRLMTRLFAMIRNVVGDTFVNHNRDVEWLHFKST